MIAERNDYKEKLKMWQLKFASSGIHVYESITLISNKFIIAKSRTKSNKCFENINLNGLFCFILFDIIEREKKDLLDRIEQLERNRAISPMSPYPSIQVY